MRYDEIINEIEYGRRLKPEDYNQILGAQRELEGLRAALRDPKTGKVYVAGSHQAAMNQIPWDDETGAYGRLHHAWDEATEDSGFVDRAGNFITRDEAGRRWDVSTIEDVRDLLRGKRR